MIELGNTIVRVVHTPGHIPESISLVVSDLRRGPVGFERRRNPPLARSEAELVDEVGGAVLPRPAGMDAILRFNQGRDR